MRFFSLFLLLSILLWGCAPGMTEEAVDSFAPAQSETAIPPTMSVTEPVHPDPLKMLLSAMTTEEKVGQLFLARCPDSNALEDIAAYHLGGFVLFAQDFQNETPDSIRQTIAGYQALSPIPMLMAVDEEGGTVCRISRYSAFRSSRFPSPRENYTSGGMEQALAAENEKSAFLKDLGLNVNLGPVCDISTLPDAFMYQRSLGQSPEETGRFVSAAVQIMKNHRIGSVLKHFPGYGNNADTHTGPVRDDRTLEELEKTDLSPFASGIQANCDAILVSHSTVSALDNSAPASLSPAVHDYLRTTMKFSGVILTDDLVMEAITENHDAGEAAILAILAGNDLLCSTEYQVQYAAVLEAVHSGRISMDRLEESVMRVLTWKKNLGLIF